MRAALIIGMAVVLLIIGILLMKNMGVGNPGGVTESEAKQYTEQAKSVADDANQRIKDLREQMSRSE